MMETRLDLRPGQVAIVIGVDHKIQHVVPHIGPNHPRNNLRLRFQEFLEQITGRYRLDVICEEAKHGVVSISQAFADLKGIPYRNIEMSPDVRRIRGIPELSALHVPGSETPRKQKRAWNALQESYMIEKLLRYVAGASSVMAICGVSHMPALIQATRPKFGRVEKYDVTAMPWFDRSVL
jgi:hypothetical protein